MEKLAREVIEMIDVYGWKLSQAKAHLAKRGMVIKARSKDELVSKLYQIKD
jgi:hypothetical protein